jgi:hypothetical protein
MEPDRGPSHHSLYGVGRLRRSLSAIQLERVRRAAWAVVMSSTTRKSEVSHWDTSVFVRYSK